jgi:hypothetical protein
MAKRLEIKGNYLILTDTITSIVSNRLPFDRITYDIYNSVLHIIYINRYDQNYNVAFADLVDGNDTPFASESALDDFMSTNTGGSQSVAATTDFMLEIPKGNIADTSYINNFGANLDVASNTHEDIWDGGGTYIFPTTADITHISQDTNQAAMLGGEIQVQGLDINWDIVNQTVNLNATNTTTQVALTTPLLRVFRMKVQADVISDANIRVHNLADSITYAQITPTNNQSLMAIYSVPRGYSAYMTQYYSDVVESTGKEPKSTEIHLLIADRLNGYEFQLKSARGIAKASSGFTHTFQPYQKVTEKSDIKFEAYCEGEDGHVHAGFDLILVKN